MVDIAYDRN
ncbi:unnamed protein product, partial [Rotaria magnacalcarata]